MGGRGKRKKETVHRGRAWYLATVDRWKQTHPCICGVPLPGRSQPRLQTTLRKRTLWSKNIGGSYYSNQSELPLPSSRKPRPTAAAAAASAEDAAAEGAQDDCAEQEDNQLLTSFLCFRFDESRSKKAVSFSFFFASR